MISSERFDIFKTEVECRGTQSKKFMFHAWFHSEDVAKPTCIVTISEFNFVEWIHVDEQFRRKGIATEVLQAIENEIGKLILDPVTKEGEEFCKSFHK